MNGSIEQRWQQRLNSYGIALKQLTDACERKRYDNLELAGLFKTSEFCFELSWNVLKDLLLYEGYDVRVPRAVIRRSFQVGYISESDCEALLDALDKRNVWSHNYLSDTTREAQMLIKEHYHPVLLQLYNNLDAKQKP